MLAPISEKQAPTVVVFDDGTLVVFYGDFYGEIWEFLSGWWFQTFFMFHNIWVNYNDLTATSLEIMVNKGNHPQMGLNSG